MELKNGAYVSEDERIVLLYFEDSQSGKLITMSDKGSQVLPDLNNFNCEKYIKRHKLTKFISADDIMSARDKIDNIISQLVPKFMGMLRMMDNDQAEQKMQNLFKPDVNKFKN